MRDAVISFTPLETVPATNTPETNRVISQKALQFQPFVTLAPVGSTIAFKNEDTVLHHVFSFSKAKRFDLKLFGRDEPQAVTFENPGIVTVGCNIHDGMISHIFIADAPFAAQTDASGLVTLEGLPSGVGELMIWHPLLKQRGNRMVETLTLDAEMQTYELSGKFRKGMKRSTDY